jgi:osmotically-inducible protein OsmY
MIRGALKFVILLAVIGAVAVFFLGRSSHNWNSSSRIPGPVDTAQVREVGAKVGEAAKEATKEVAIEARHALEAGRVTAKIKSKMALDDLVKARSIDVDTEGSVVTLTGAVSSEAERERALQLARQTEGVTGVVDRLNIR